MTQKTASNFSADDLKQLSGTDWLNIGAYSVMAVGEWFAYLVSLLGRKLSLLVYIPAVYKYHLNLLGEVNTEIDKDVN